MRQLASYLAMPILLVDPVGTLLFYNEPPRSSWAGAMRRRGKCRSPNGRASFG
jgi:hypothetical protein